MSSHRWTILACAVLVTASCKRPPAAEELAVARAQFGIFYGGQVQERREIPFELDRSRQALGFVLQFAQPLAKPVELRWELSKPGKPAARGAAARDPKNQLSAPEHRTTQLHQRLLAAGDQRVVQPLAFTPGDTPGLWNLRVTLPDQVVLDRPFTVYDPQLRRRNKRQAHPDDGGLF